MPAQNPITTFSKFLEEHPVIRAIWGFTLGWNVGAIATGILLGAHKSSKGEPEISRAIAFPFDPRTIFKEKFVSNNFLKKLFLVPLTVLLGIPIVILFFTSGLITLIVVSAIQKIKKPGLFKKTNNTSSGSGGEEKHHDTNSFFENDFIRFSDPEIIYEKTPYYTKKNQLSNIRNILVNKFVEDEKAIMNDGDQQQLDDFFKNYPFEEITEEDHGKKLAEYIKNNPDLLHEGAALNTLRDEFEKTITNEIHVFITEIYTKSNAAASGALIVRDFLEKFMSRMHKECQTNKGLCYERIKNRLITMLDTPRPTYGALSANEGMSQYSCARIYHPILKKITDRISPSATETSPVSTENPNTPSFNKSQSDKPSP